MPELLIISKGRVKTQAHLSNSSAKFSSGWCCHFHRYCTDPPSHTGTPWLLELGPKSTSMATSPIVYLPLPGSYSSILP